MSLSALVGCCVSKEKTHTMEIWGQKIYGICTWEWRNIPGCALCLFLCMAKTFYDKRTAPDIHYKNYQTFYKDSALLTKFL